jgi:hypothetical protein
MLTIPALLPSVRPDQRDQLQLDVHLPRAQGAAQGGPGNPVRELWLPRMLVERLRDENKRKKGVAHSVGKRERRGPNDGICHERFVSLAISCFSWELWRTWRSLFMDSMSSFFFFFRKFSMIDSGLGLRKW